MTIPATGLALAGGVVILLFQGAGGRMPQDLTDPLVEFVWPIWSTGTSAFGAPDSAPFARNLAGLTCPEAIAALPQHLRWLQFMPLPIFQAVMIGMILLISRHRADDPVTPRSG